MQETMQRLTEQVHTILEEELGLSSRWSGIIRIEESDRFSGLKEWNCNIVYTPEFSDDPALRISTVIHEILHSFSVELNKQDFAVHRFYEEGVVEMLTRILRPLVLEKVGMDPNLDFSSRDESHPFNSIIAQLEADREQCGMEKHEFYRELLKTPLVKRRSKIGLWIVKNKTRGSKKTLS
jgi:hypothetical protein